MFAMGAWHWIITAGKLSAVYSLATLASTFTSAVEDHHAPRHQRRSLQSSSSIVFINAIEGTTFTSSEEDAVQLQVRVLDTGKGLLAISKKSDFRM